MIAPSHDFCSLSPFSEQTPNIFICDPVLAAWLWPMRGLLATPWSSLHGGSNSSPLGPNVIYRGGDEPTDKTNVPVSAAAHISRKKSDPCWWHLSLRLFNLLKKKNTYVAPFFVLTKTQLSSKRQICDSLVYLTTTLFFIPFEIWVKSQNTHNYHEGQE